MTDVLVKLLKKYNTLGFWGIKKKLKDTKIDIDKSTLLRRLRRIYRKK